MAITIHKNFRSYSIIKNKWFNPILVCLAFLGFFCVTSAFALDPATGDLKGIMTDAKENFGSNSALIRLFYAAEIIAGAYAWHKSKHPSAVIGIVVLALFVTYALKTWVFA